MNVRTPIVLVAALALLAPVAAGAATLFNNTNGQAVSNNPSVATTFEPTCNAHVSQLVTYHWNGGRGSAPGTISLRSNATGQTYGPFPAQGSAGQNNAPNVNWTANVSIDLPGGATYVVEDSDKATWSTNFGSGNRGFAEIVGECASVAQKTLAPAGAPAAPLVIRTVAPVPPAPAQAGKPCFVNTGSIAATGPCFGPPGSTMTVYVYNTARGPYTQVQFRIDATRGVPLYVSAPIVGSGSTRTVTVPAALCGARSNAKFQVWLLGPNGNGGVLGEIGEFTITACP